jgi:formate hydrogenlyase subunit 3/multisubunit Na+/H+ antiporter MnhD subunit
VLWYGFVYYTLFLILTFVSVVFLFRLVFASVFYRTVVVHVVLRSVLGFFVGLALLLLTVLYYLLDYFSTFTVAFTSDSASFSVMYFDVYALDYLVAGYSTSLHLSAIYYFPFIYIFLLVTLLSILFCMAYNTNELMSFMFYCTVILGAGYLLFFTDSIILFFLAYELLLVPSFFILYNFAKTRRCVEAAYLMFF